jgi:hypothetical protein
MTTTTQIIAVTNTGVNLIWHETQNDWVAYHQEVPNTDESELINAIAKAFDYPAIKKVWMEVIDAETNELVATNI